MQNLPVVDEARIKFLFSELESMEVDLDDDPLSFGPKRLNGKVSLVRRLLTRCERVFLQVSYDLQLYKRSHRASQLDFDLQMQDLIANDVEVRSGRNVRDRDAIATMKLRKERERLMAMEIGIQDLEMVMAVIKAKRADLRDLQGRLRDQIKLCQEEIGLGSRWGSKPPPGSKVLDLSKAPTIDPTTLAEIQELAALSDEEIHMALSPEEEREILSQLSKGDEDEDEVTEDEVEVEEVEEVVEGDNEHTIPQVESDHNVDLLFSLLDEEEVSPPETEIGSIDDMITMLGDLG